MGELYSYTNGGGNISVEISKKPARDADYSKWQEDAETVYGYNGYDDILDFLQKYSVLKIPKSITKQIVEERKRDFKSMDRNFKSHSFPKMLKSKKKKVQT